VDFIVEAYRLFIGVVLITNELRKNAISLQSQVAFDEGLCASIQALSKGTVGLRASPIAVLEQKNTD